MVTLIAYNGEGYRYLGYTTSGEFNGLFVGINESPIIVTDTMLIGVLNNKSLQQYLMTNGHSIPDTSYRSVLQSFDFIKGYEQFKLAEMLMITADGKIFLWVNGLMYDIRGMYMAIGSGAEVAMGCMYGLRASEYAHQERIEITLKAISYNRPNQAMSTGLERI